MYQTATDVSMTQREEEVLHLLAKFHSYREMCIILGISRNTVKRHIENIMAKTDIHRKDLLIKYAIEHGYGKQEVSA